MPWSLADRLNGERLRCEEDFVFAWVRPVQMKLSAGDLYMYRPDCWTPRTGYYLHRGLVASSMVRVVLLGSGAWCVSD